MELQVKYYKIVEIDKKGNYKTLFHGNNGSRIMEKGKWLKSEQKIVRDGSKKTSKEYTSGWHCMSGPKKRVEEFVKKYFKAKRELKVVKIEIRGNTWPKAHSPHNIILAEEIKILE